MTPATIEEPRHIFPELAGTRRFTVDEYHRLIEADILGPDDKVELLDGYVLFKAGYPELQPTDTVFPEWQRLRPWTVAECHRMLDLGIIDREEKLELLDGYLVLKMGQNPPHRGAMTRLQYVLPTRLPSGWVCMTNSTVATGLFEPEPDVVIVRGSVTDYDARDPVPADFGIVIEVSDSTLEGDRARKSRLFAKIGLPVYWIVNVADKQIEVYTNPDATAYKTRTDYAPGDAVPITLDGNVVGTIPVSELLP